MNIRAKAPLCNAEPAAGGKPPAASALPARSPAFTLIELLVVLGIMGLLAAIALPNLRNMTKSNALIAANRQMLDDISYARQRAIADHTTVYMVFIPPDITNVVKFPLPASPRLQLAQRNLYGGQFTTYALISMRSVGEQPGQSTPKYLTPWRTLPGGIFIAESKFRAPFNVSIPPFTLGVGFPFPVSTNFPTSPTQMLLPFVGFDFLGRLVSGRDELIPLARGSILYGRDASGNYNTDPADVQESPNGNSTNNINIVHIDWLTGRARIDKLEVGGL